MPIIQNFYGSIGTSLAIENLQGDLTIGGQAVLTKKSTARDVDRQLSDIRSAIATLPNVEQATRDNVIANIDAAKRETASEKPKGTEIQANLNRAASALQGATTTASNAFSLAKVLFEIGKWAAAFLL
jgi:hypothetical protein